MSFSFFKASRPKTPSELARTVKDSFNALDSITVAEVKALEKAMEEVEKNIVAMKVMLAGDGEVEPNPDQVAQLTLEVFVANPNKPREIKLILAKNHEGLLALLNNLGKGGEDDQFEEEKELIMKEIEKVSRLES